MFAHQTMAALPGFDGVVNVAQGTRIAHGSFGSLSVREVLAVETPNTYLPDFYLETMGLGVSRCRHVFIGSRKGLNAIAKKFEKKPYTAIWDQKIPSQ